MNRARTPVALCSAGHDMSLVGKTRDGYCRACARGRGTWKKRRRAPKKRAMAWVLCGACTEPFYLPVGRLYCSIGCAGASKRKTICVNGHDKRITGVSKQGQCSECLRANARRRIAHDPMIGARRRERVREKLEVCDWLLEHFLDMTYEEFMEGAKEILEETG